MQKFATNLFSYKFLNRWSTTFIKFINFHQGCVFYCTTKAKTIDFLSLFQVFLFWNMVHQMFPLKQGGIDFLPMISLITARRGFICYGKRSENNTADHTSRLCFPIKRSCEQVINLVKYYLMLNEHWIIFTRFIR